MLNQSISEKLKQVIAQHLDVAQDKVNDDAIFTDDLGADSLDSVDLLMAVNEAFGTHISNEALPNIHTVGDMIATVEKALK